MFLPFPFELFSTYQAQFQLDEIAAALGLTEYEVDQIRAKALRDLETMLAGRLGLERRDRNCEKLSASNGSRRSSTRLAATAKPSHDNGTVGDLSCLVSRRENSGPFSIRRREFFVPGESLIRALKSSGER